MNPEIPIPLTVSLRERAALKRVVRDETGTGARAADDRDLARAVLRRLLAAAESKHPDAKRAAPPERQAFDASVNPALEGFLREMRRKLWANRHKGNRAGWIDDDSLDLFERLEEEVKELGQALDRWPANSRRIVREAADVANFAMMIADQLAQPEAGL